MHKDHTPLINILLKLYPTKSKTATCQQVKCAYTDKKYETEIQKLGTRLLINPCLFNI